MFEACSHLNFPEITISSINCNSLNISQDCSKHQMLKIYGITKLKTDIILLSDIRLNSNIRKAETLSICKTFFTNPYCSYDFFYNSQKNSRGVGILLKHNLNFTAELLEEDDRGNLLALSVCLQGKKFTLISVYGPNEKDLNFFATLESVLLGLIYVYS